MDRIWYYAVDGERHGPVTFEELQAQVAAGRVKPLDLVWQPEFGPDWRNAGQVRELFAPDRAVAPPLPRTDAAINVPLTGVAGDRPSCLAAVSDAFAGMTAILFRPFDMTRWFSIGFCAWLAMFGTQMSFNPAELKLGREEAELRAFKTAVDNILERLASHSWGVAEALAIAVTLLFALLFCKLRSRGDFMFLHRWYSPDATIRHCWTASRAAGQELFVWRVYLYVIVTLLLTLDGVAAYGYVVKPYLAAGKVWDVSLRMPAAGFATAATLILTVAALVSHLTKAFVAPVMYWHGVNVARGWLAVFGLCNQYPFAVIGYLVCGMVCAMAAGLALLAVGILTCCIGFIPFMLPYFGAVAMLPYSLFFRGYTVCFLSRWRQDLVPASA
ncbi:MAG: DUF4339 domain-containing protein [Kiritimatiellae bacterium]|nr:DUF4339 domain-containing protein [Kiritimatiellia bacterium]